MKHLTYLVVVMALLVVSQTAQGAVLSSCDQWASYCSGSYCVYNAQWGMVSGSNQCITASSATSWYVVATQPSNGIKSYPNSGYLPSTTVGTSISSSVSTSSPSSGNWNLAYDVWAPQEVMIWLRWMGAVGPWGSYVTSATIDGRGWDVYKNGYPGYLAQSQLSGGTFNISAFLADSVSRGWLSNGATVTPVQCGWEITGCSNQTFTMNSFSVSVGGASTTTTAASTTTTAASTTTTAATTSTTSATTSTTAASTTTTTAAAGCTCDSGCNGSSISPNFTKDGAGQFCWQATSGTYINSWNLNKLEVNNTVYTNTYVFTSSFPAKINGIWYIYYDGSYAWSHFELKN